MYELYPPALATAEVKKGNWAEAIELFSCWMDRGYEPFDHRIYYNRAYCYYKMDDLSHAMTDVDTCLMLKPKWTKCHFLKGKIAFEGRDWKMASECFHFAYNDGKVNRKKVKYWIQLTIFSYLLSLNVPSYKAELASMRYFELEDAKDAIDNNAIEDCIFWLQHSKFEKFNHLFKAKGKVFPITWFQRSNSMDSRNSESAEC